MVVVVDTEVVDEGLLEAVMRTDEPEAVVIPLKKEVTTLTECQPLHRVTMIGADTVTYHPEGPVLMRIDGKY